MPTNLRLALYLHYHYEAIKDLGENSRCNLPLYFFFSSRSEAATRKALNTASCKRPALSVPLYLN